MLTAFSHGAPASRVTSSRAQVQQRIAALPRPRMIVPRATTGASDIAPNTAGMAIDKLIIADHDKVRSLFAEYESSSSPEQKQQIAYMIIRELSMHASKEEDAVYPVFKQIFGAQQAQHLWDQHYLLKVQLDKLSGMDITQDEHAFDRQVMSAKSEFLNHGKEEEDIEIPRLLKALPQHGMDPFTLGQEFQKAAEHAVTRPHPDAPDKPPLSTIAKKMTAPIDAVADAVRFGTAEPSAEKKSEKGL